MLTTGYATDDGHKNVVPEMPSLLLHLPLLLVFRLFVFLSLFHLTQSCCNIARGGKSYVNVGRFFGPHLPRETHFTQRDCKINSNDERALFRTTFSEAWKEQCTHEVPSDKKPKAPRDVHTRPFVSPENSAHIKHTFAAGEKKIKGEVLPCWDLPRTQEQSKTHCTQITSLRSPT